MLKNKFYRTLLVVGITGSLIISTSLVAFASSTKSTTTSKTKIGDMLQRAGKGFMQKGDMQRGNPLASVLKAQVTSGNITQAKSDAITKYLTTKAADNVKMAAERTKLEAMTDAERQAYMKTNKPIKGDILAELVTAKLLTQDQATKIQAAMPQKTEGGKNHSGQFGRSGQGMQQGNPIAAMLKTQVTAKVITQVESDKVTAFLKTKEDAKKAEMTARKAKLDAMTPAEKATRDVEKATLEAMTPEAREAYMKANKLAHKNIFAEIVTAGILTQNQVNKIKASIPQRSQKGNWNGQKPAGAPTTNSTDVIE